MLKKNTKFLILILVVGICVISLFWAANRFSDSKQQSPPQSQEPGITEKKSEETISPSSTAVSNILNFFFAVQADPHMDDQSDPQTYKQTLQNITDAKPAFLVDLGDIFMVDKLADKSETNITDRYVQMKSYYDLLGSIPLYFAMGNHDGETGWDSLNTKKYRELYFPEQTSEKNYNSFEQNNALFVVLDPYSYTLKKPNSDGWGWTLGKTQYDWLKTTLENSDAKFKFIFIHQLVGGDNQGRGGVEFAKLFEWGGNNPDGSYGFDANRPGWGKPIHQLFVDNNVNIVFKGHDHFYAKQQLDGVVYQTVPQPSHPGDKINTAEEYGYVNGEILGGSGYLRVDIADTETTVQFIEASEKQEVLDTYSITSR